MMEKQHNKMDFNRADNCVLQKNYTAGPASQDIDWPFDAIENEPRGVVERRLSFSLSLSLFHTGRKHDVHLISHLDNRAVVSRTNDILRGIWRRIGRNGNELFNIAYWRSHLITMSDIFIIVCFQKVKCKTRELLLMYQANWNSYRAHTDKDFNDAVIIDTLCMSYRIALQLCICMRIEKINKRESIWLN